MTKLLDIPFGKRYVGYWDHGYGNQVPVENREEIYGVIDEHLGIDNLGISVCTFKDSKPYLLFLPFDFDSLNLKDAWSDTVKLYNHLVIGGYDTHLTFSGRKGFHIFLSVIPKFYSREQIRSVQLYFKEKLKLETLDKQIFGDARRLMRIPHTYNIRGGLCRELKRNKGTLLDLDLIVLKHHLPKYETTYEEVDFHKYNCIEKLVREDPEPRHIIRFTYTILRLAHGWSEDDIIDEMKSFDWVDFNEEYCRNQIRHIDENSYVPPSCKTLKGYGYCDKDCNYRDDELKEIGII